MKLKYDFKKLFISNNNIFNFDILIKKYIHLNKLINSNGFIDLAFFSGDQLGGAKKVDDTRAN